MQLTRFDRWLRDRFVHETHVYTMRPAETVPPGVHHRELPDNPGRQYHHLYVSRSTKRAEELVSVLKQDSRMFTTRVIDRKAWYVPIVAPSGNRSFTWRLVWMLVGSFSTFCVLAWMKSLWDQPEVRANILDAIRIFKS